MDRLKNYSILILAVFLIVLAGVNKLQKISNDTLRKENGRISYNNQQLVQDTAKKRTLILSERKDKENYKKLYHEKDSLAKVYKTRTKYIDKIVTREVTEKITAIHPVPVSLIGKNTWQINDSGPCFVWRGIVYLSNDSLKVNRTYFSYSNKLTNIHYRTAKHFLGIRISKFRFFERDSSECGCVQVREYQFVK